MKKKSDIKPRDDCNIYFAADGLNATFDKHLTRVTVSGIMNTLISINTTVNNPTSFSFNIVEMLASE